MSNNLDSCTYFEAKALTIIDNTLIQSYQKCEWQLWANYCNADKKQVGLEIAILMHEDGNIKLWIKNHWVSLALAHVIAATET